MNKYYTKEILEYAKECFDIDEETGLIYHKKDRPLGHFKTKRAYAIWKKRDSGKIAGAKVFYRSRDRYYIQMYIKGRLYQGHTVAYALYHNHWPTYSIDHIDGDTLNNKKDNLRDVPHKINMRNREMSSNNTTGYCGVWYRKDRKKWIAEGQVDGKKHHLGQYECKEDAYKARIEWQNSLNCFTERHGKKKEG